MTLQEMTDLIRQHHPDMGLSEIVTLVNRAQDDFTTKTRMIKEAVTFPLNEVDDNQRYYALEGEWLEVLRVEMENDDGDVVQINRATHVPHERDFS